MKMTYKNDSAMGSTWDFGAQSDVSAMVNTQSLGMEFYGEWVKILERSGGVWRSGSYES